MKDKTLKRIIKLFKKSHDDEMKSIREQNTLLELANKEYKRILLKAEYSYDHIYHIVTKAINEDELG